MVPLSAHFLQYAFLRMRFGAVPSGIRLWKKIVRVGLQSKSLIKAAQQGTLTDGGQPALAVGRWP